MCGDKIYDEQYRFIKRYCGKDAADNANYGWFVDDVYVLTKVYGHGVIGTPWKGQTRWVTRNGGQNDR